MPGGGHNLARAVRIVSVDGEGQIQFLGLRYKKIYSAGLMAKRWRFIDWLRVLAVPLFPVTKTIC